MPRDKKAVWFVLCSLFCFDIFVFVTQLFFAHSLESHSKNGFGRNFCAENKESAEDWIESSCEWGTIPVSIAIGGLSVGLATPVALYVVGMGGTLCSKIASDAGKWPNNQY